MNGTSCCPSASVDDDENSLVLVLGIIGAAAALPVLSWPRITEAMCRWFETADRGVNDDDVMERSMVG